MLLFAGNFDPALRFRVHPLPAPRQATARPASRPYCKRRVCPLRQPLSAAFQLCFSDLGTHPGCLARRSDSPIPSRGVTGDVYVNREPTPQTPRHSAGLSLLLNPSPSAEVSARSCKSSPAVQKEQFSPSPKSLMRVGSHNPLLEPKEAKGTSKLTHPESEQGTSFRPVCRRPLRILRAACVQRFRMRFREAEAVRQLLPLGAHHVVVLLEGVFQPQKLGRGKGGSDSLRLSGQSVVQKEALRACVVPCAGHRSPVKGGRPGRGHALLPSRADPAPRSEPPLSWCGSTHGDPGPSRGAKEIPVQLPGTDRRGCTCAAPTQQLPRRVTGFAAALAPRASPSPSRAPKAEEGAARLGPRIGAQDPKKRLSHLSNLWGNFAPGMGGGPCRDRNLAGGCTGFLLPLPPEAPAPPLPCSRELGDASKGIENRAAGTRSGCLQPWKIPITLGWHGGQKRGWQRMRKDSTKLF
ncbi:hypothetical protein Cadr_000009604 [Camelus dromedarius]|uniref:Uncharacterized protein n=1 Tax=Camelus dromedarius TaxID=9838 RepID=A0A5N4DKY0_CAMDR|nr:hypothetical protein Cadr_000009604 [Camelus dromedarius]